MTKNRPPLSPNALRFARQFSSDIKKGLYTKDRLPNQGVPMSLEYAVERKEIFDAMMDAKLLE